MLNPATLFSGIPAGLRDPLIAAYREIATNYSEHRWEPAELNGGKLCEIIYCIIDGATSGNYPPAPSKPNQFVTACRQIEQRAPIAGSPSDRTLRLLIPRVLPFLYDIRNNRGVGHVGGDVNPNAIDASVVFSCSSWLMAELVRVYHAVSLQEAQTAVDALAERKHPLIWEVDGTGSLKRVLHADMPAEEQTLLLLYGAIGWVSESDLRAWVEYKNSTHFRSRILEPGHRQRLFEYDTRNSRVKITPLGSKQVEEVILPKYRN